MNDLKCNGPKWIQIRRDILKFFHYTCQKCKISFIEKEVFVPYRKRPLEIHHIEPKYYGGLDLVLNFTVLCIKCHKIETRKINQIQQKQKRLHRKIDKNQEKLR